MSAATSEVSPLRCELIDISDNDTGCSDEPPSSEFMTTLTEDPIYVNAIIIIHQYLCLIVFEMSARDALIAKIFIQVQSWKFQKFQFRYCQWLYAGRRLAYLSKPTQNLASKSNSIPSRSIVRTSFKFQ